MTTRYLTLIGIQTDAINAILSLREQGKRAAAYGFTLLNKPPRSLHAIRKIYEKQATRMGWSAGHIQAQWNDVKDMAKLEALAE